MAEVKDKSLKSKAISIKGKEYVLVSDRVLYFNEVYPNGSISTELVTEPGNDMVIVKATVHPDHEGNRAFTGYSQATWGDGYINKSAALENAETSAVGRALALMGIGVIDSIASVDEINKAEQKTNDRTDRVTQGYISNIHAMEKELGEPQGSYADKSQAALIARGKELAAKVEAHREAIS